MGVLDGELGVARYDGQSRDREACLVGQGGGLCGGERGGGRSTESEYRL